MKFKVRIGDQRLPAGSLVYRTEEYSFDFEPAPAFPTTSVLVNDLNLELDQESRLVSVWGMCPYGMWKHVSLRPPLAKVGEVFVVSEAPLLPGVSAQVNSEACWPVYFDKESGWARVTNDASPVVAVNALPGVIVETTVQGDMASLWLKPASWTKQIL